MKVLITGATGFVGRNMAEHFGAMPGVEVFGTYLDSDPWPSKTIKFLKADLTRREDVDRVVKGMDVVIQAAATTSGAKDIVQKPYYHVTDNAVMNSLILRSAFEHKVSKFVFFSCTVMYQSGEQPVKETDFDANMEMHRNYFGVGWTKVYIEKQCEFYSRIGSTQFTVIRHSNIYGPHDKYDLERSHVFGATLTKVMKAEGDSIVVWGSGEEKRDLLYVSDLVNFVEMALSKQACKYGLYNVGQGSCISVAELVGKIIKISGRNLAVKHDLSKPTIKTALALDTSKAKGEIGWEPQVSLDDGIRKTVAWYKEYFGI
jgi:nucleoside-diphosphate-sugar epimerase